MDRVVHRHTVFPSLGAVYSAGYFVSSYTVVPLLFQLLCSINTWAWLIFVLSCGIPFSKSPSTKAR
jgi:hypothetical protein